MVKTKNLNCKPYTLDINALSDYIHSINNHKVETTNTVLESQTETFEDKMKNHLTPISAFVDLMIQGKIGKISESQMERLELIRTEVEKISELLNIAKEEIVPKYFSANDKTKQLDLKLELLKTELKRHTKQIQQLGNEKSDSANLEREFVKYDLNAISSEITKTHKILRQKNNKIFTVMAITALIIISGTNLAHSENIFEISNDKISYTSKYVIENLRGDMVKTFKFWKILPDESLHISIVNSANLSEERLEIVKSAILSNASIEIDDIFLHKGPKGHSSTYFLGWSGALATIFDETIYDIPKKFEFTDSRKGVGDIIITLSNLRDSDGYAGYTNSIISGDQILKSRITIYQADQLSENGLSTITRHEFGHALGLVHSSAPEDLMYPEIITAYPYISECSISAITQLYDGNVDGEVICEI